MKTYNTGEVIIKLIENPKQIFKYNTGREIGYVTNVDGDIKIELNINQFSRNAMTLSLHKGYTKLEWTLVQQPVTFMEAANSGKRIKREIWEEFHNLDDIIDILNDLNEDTIREYLNGNWNVEVVSNE